MREAVPDFQNQRDFANETQGVKHLNNNGFAVEKSRNQSEKMIRVIDVEQEVRCSGMTTQIVANRPADALEDEPIIWSISTCPSPV
jgi:hypothetical protein